MCWAYRVSSPSQTAEIDALEYDLIAPHAGRITCAGKEAAMLVNRRGSLRWMSSRYGMLLPQAGKGRQLIWNARDDKLDTIELWARLIRQRFAVPIDAYVETAPAETWYVGPDAWMVGFYNTDDNGGAVTITEAEGDRRVPILIGRDAAMAWLEATQWDAMPSLARADRIRFAEADIFESKTLSTDARTRVPLAKAA